MTQTPFVSTDWLAANINRADLAVVDASWYLPTMNRDGKAEYAQAHIPKAVHFDIDAVKDAASPLPHMLPSPDVFAAAAGAMGISEDMTIVVYDGAGLFAAPRVRWTFLVMGAKDVRILDGGLPSGAPRAGPSSRARRRRSPGPSRRSSTPPPLPISRPSARPSTAARRRCSMHAPQPVSPARRRSPGPALRQAIFPAATTCPSTGS